jgi:hypothetical protein
MQLRISGSFAIAAVALTGVLGSAPAQAQFTQQAKLVATDIISSTIIYTVALPLAGDIAVNGTITTDGKLGTLTAADVLDFDLIVSSLSLGASNEILGPGHGALANTYVFDFEGVAATDTTLFAQALSQPPGEMDLESLTGAYRAQVIVTPVPPGGYAEILQACTLTKCDENEIGLPLSGVEVATHRTSVPGTLQGSSVSLSGDGSTAIVGGPSDNAGTGAVWVYTRAGGTWSQQAKLVGTVIAAGAAAEGSSVSLSGDGNTAIVGRPGDSSAWVYTRAGGAWSREAELIAPGGESLSVSLSGDGNTAIVGRPGEGAVGAAYVFARSGAAWSQQAKLVGTGAIGPLSAFQGFSVSISADGNTAIVGGSTDNNELGAAWVFTRASGMWSQQAKLVGTGAVSPAEQGYAVSLSSDGNTAIVGGPLDNGAAGAAWVFTRASGMWSQQAQLTGTGAVNIAEQGASVSLSGDGNIAIVGGPDESGGAGATWVFVRSRAAWSQQAKLVGTGAVGVARQGISVSLSGDGSTVVVGGPEDSSNAGAAWVYSRPVFAGTPGKANCQGQSVAALARRYGGLNGAAAALGYADVSALQGAIMTFCEG